MHALLRAKRVQLELAMLQQDAVMLLLLLAKVKPRAIM